VAAVVAAATLSTTQAAYAGPDGPTLPPGTENIAAPAGNKVFLVGHATGVQTYTCNAGTWSTPKSVPTADLVGNNDKNVIVKHSAGPTWTATDGSTAVKDPAEAKSAPSPNGSIDWLLLKINGAAGRNGDRLAGTTFIQRVNTTGGVGPTGACDPVKTPTVDVPYTADYYFYKATGGPGA
jgi:hypothetical protein